MCSNTSKMVSLEEKSLNLSFMEYQRMNDFFDKTTQFMDKMVCIQKERNESLLLKIEDLSVDIHLIANSLCQVGEAMLTMAKSFKALVENRTDDNSVSHTPIANSQPDSANNSNCVPIHGSNPFSSDDEPVLLPNDNTQHQREEEDLVYV